MKPVVKVKREIMLYPREMNLYFPNLCTWLETDTRTMQTALDELLAAGLIRRMQTIRYKNEILSEYTVPEGQEFEWDSIQDPDDFIPLTKADVEIVGCYRTTQ